MAMLLVILTFVLYALILYYLTYADSRDELQEHFSTQAMNSYSETLLNNADVESPWEEQGTTIDTLLAGVSTQPFPDTRDFIKGDDVNFNALLKRFALGFLQNTLAKDSFANHKFDILQNIYGAQYRDKVDATGVLMRELVYTVHLVNKTAYFVRDIDMFVELELGAGVLTDAGAYSPTLSDTTLASRARVRGARLTQQEKPVSTTIQATDALSPMYYRIANSLHISDPLLTSGKDMLITDDMRRDFNASLRKKQSTSTSTNAQVMCFGAMGESPDRSTCESKGGIWDAPPAESSDCPFYLQNNNYPNSFGGMVGQYCQVPRNARLLGYKQIDPDPAVQPLCYNCKDTDARSGEGSLGMCCDKQADRKLYPALASPDYAFPGDEAIRKKYSDAFVNRGLSVT